MESSIRAILGRVFGWKNQPRMMLFAPLIVLLDILPAAAGKFFFAEFCLVARRPESGRVAYHWPKVGEKMP